MQGQDFVQGARESGVCRTGLRPRDVGDVLRTLGRIGLVMSYKDASYDEESSVS